jgi:hypothetical protein
MGRSDGGLIGKIGPVFWSPFAMAVVALAFRLVVMCFTYRIQLDPSQDHLAFGWETGRVARSVVTGEGFSSPYSEPTGPTALIPPVYPYLVAGVFKLFGIYTASSALVLLTLNNVVSSLTCLPIFLIARKVFGLHVAVWAGWTWAIFPYSIGLSNTVIWETSLTTLLLTLAVLVTLYLEKSNRLFDWIGYGLLCGLHRPHQPGNPFRTAVSRRLDLDSTLVARKQSHGYGSRSIPRLFRHHHSLDLAMQSNLRKARRTPR